METLYSLFFGFIFFMFMFCLIGEHKRQYNTITVKDINIDCFTIRLMESLGWTEKNKVKRKW